MSRGTRSIARFALISRRTTPYGVPTINYFFNMHFFLQFNDFNVLVFTIKHILYVFIFIKYFLKSCSVWGPFECNSIKSKNTVKTHDDYTSMWEHLCLLSQCGFGYNERKKEKCIYGNTKKKKKLYIQIIIVYKYI